MIVLVRSAIKQVLQAAGLARKSEVEHERRAAAAIRTAERARAGRAAALASSRPQAVEEKLHAAHERATAEHTGRSMLQGVLRHYLVRLTQAEAELSGKLAGERRVKLAQLAIGARAARRRDMSSSAAARAAELASVSGAYSAAAVRWRSGDIPADIRRGTVAGLRWALPAGVVAEDAMVDGVLDPAWLPLHDLAAVRHFAVGGVMLDIGGEVGATSIPRIVLGDFARAYVAEPDEAKYLCLVGNTLENHLEGRVLPDRVALSDAAGAAPVSLDAWTERLRIPVDRVRFVRVAWHAAAMGLFEDASRLLAQRQIVWQVEVNPSAATGPGLEALSALLASRFTHVTEIGGVANTEWHRASDVTALLERVAGERRTANLLLFNLRGGSTRRRRAVAPPPALAESAGRPAIISVLHSTARLPDGWRPAMEAFHSKAVHPELVEYILAIDEDQDLSLPSLEGTRWRRFEVVKKGVKGPAAACNVAAQASRGDLLVQVADDYFPPPAWDEALRAAVPDFEEEVVLDVDNSDGSTWLLPFSMLTRTYYERYGYIFYPGYHGLCADNEFTEQARRDKVVRPARHIVFEHRHVDRGHSTMDAIYERQKQHYEKGQALFKKRQAQGFPKWPD